MRIPEELRRLLEGGTNATVVCREVDSELPEDVYETICALANRDGGHLFLGVREDGQVVGIPVDRVERFKRQIEADVRDEEKMQHGMDLYPVCYEVDGKRILYVRVPPSADVSYWMGRLWDRRRDCNEDITHHRESMRRMFFHKYNLSAADTVTRCGVEDLRHDLIDRVRDLTSCRTPDHPWKRMSDEELLRDAGLLRRHELEGIEGITKAGILLFADDTTIMTEVTWHEITAGFRASNGPRYEDLAYVGTNLLDSFDRLMAFGRRHLSGLPWLEESTRDRILHEIISNLLVHRDYSNSIRSLFVIENDRIRVVNGNVPHISGPLDLAGGKPYAKNPTLAKVFREIGLAEGTGSGLRTIAKYARFAPRFTEGDVFETVIPLSEAAAAAVVPIGPVFK